VKSSLLFISLCLTIAHSSLAQRLGTDLLAGGLKVEIPFKLKAGFIVVKLYFDNKLPMEFIFDTGAEHSILFHKAYADLLQVEYSKRIEIKGSDLSESQYALIARDIKLKLEDQIPVERDVLVLEDELQLFQESLGFQLDGVLGGSFFRGLVLEINYRSQKIILYNPDSYVHKKKGFSKYKIEVNQNKPYIIAESVFTPGDTTMVKLLIDTGASLPFLLHANTDSSIVIPARVIRGTIGQGISGSLEGYIGKIHSLGLGKFHFGSLLTLFQDLTNIDFRDNFTLVRNGILGNELLSRFTLIINYLKEEIYLKPNKKYNSNFEYDKSGLIIFAFGPDLRQFYVKSVLPDTPAEKADIRPGDLILKIGLWRHNFWTLERIARLLQGKPNKKIRIVIERNGVKMKKSFLLEDFLAT